MSKQKTKGAGEASAATIRPPRRTMGQGPNMMRGEKARDFGGTLRKTLRYFGAYKWLVLFVLLFAVGSTVLFILGPRIMGSATDLIVDGTLQIVAGTGSIDFTAIRRILLTLAALYTASALLNYLQGFIMAGITSKMSNRMRNDIDAKIHRLPFRYLDGAFTGDIMSRITNDVATVGQTMNQSLAQIISSGTMVLGAIIMMLTISWQMTLATLMVIPLTLVAILFIVGKSQKHFIRQQQHLGQVNAHIEEMLGNHTVVRAFNGEAASMEDFDSCNEPLYRAGWKSNFLSGIIMPVNSFISNLGYVAVCILGGALAVGGAVTVGNIQSFIIYVRNFNQPLSQIANISNVLQQAMACAERVFEFLEEPEEEPDSPDSLKLRRRGADEAAGEVSIRGDVAFAHVDFGYAPEHPVIHDFSAIITAGQKVAIVGPTGAGKTTMVKLLMRFYDVTGGAILVDGYNVKQFKRDELRGLFGMVLQDTWLFHGTIADNIRYGKLSATDEEVRAAAKAAQADHFISTLPDGYNMILNEETSNVSQGQKQLLTIARAILADPQILILDEATSSVDTRTEVLIQRAMDNLMRGRTSFVIAHRLSTIRNSDTILVMRDGAIVEHGTHDNLLAADGFYAELYNSQFSAGED